MKMGFDREQQEEKLKVDQVSQKGATAADLADLNEGICQAFFDQKPVDVLSNENAGTANDTGEYKLITVTWDNSNVFK